MLTRIRKALSRWLGRDGVVTVAVVTSAVIALLPVFGWADSTTGAVTAALTALSGFVAAAFVSIDRALPMLTGLGKSVITVVLAFGVHLPDNYVTAIMAFLTVVAGLATRPQVGAIQPPRDRRGREVDRNGWPVGQLDVAIDDAIARDTADAPPTGWDPRTAPPGPLIDRGEFTMNSTEQTLILPSEGQTDTQQQRAEHEQRGRHWRDDTGRQWFGGPDFSV